MDAFGIPVLLQIIKWVNRLKFSNPDSSQIPYTHFKLQPTSKAQKKTTINNLTYLKDQELNKKYPT
jgi:hypothetical protein